MCARLVQAHPQPLRLTIRHCLRAGARSVSRGCCPGVGCEQFSRLKQRAAAPVGSHGRTRQTSGSTSHPPREAHAVADRPNSANMGMYRAGFRIPAFPRPPCMIRHGSSALQARDGPRPERGIGGRYGRTRRVCRRTYFAQGAGGGTDRRGAAQVPCCCRPWPSRAARLKNSSA